VKTFVVPWSYELGDNVQDIVDRNSGHDIVDTQL
jgi:hypothetical protein